MQPYLPPSVVWRTDKDHMGFYFTMNRLKYHNDIYRQLLSDEWQKLCVYIDEKKLQQVIDDYDKDGKPESAELLWEALSLAFWLKNDYSRR